VRPIVRASAIALLARYPANETLAARATALSDSDPLVRLTAVSTFESAMPDERMAHLLPLLRDAKYAVRCEAARLLSVVSRDNLPSDAKTAFDGALRDYIASQDASLDHPAAHLNLAVLWENLAMPEIFSSQDTSPATMRRLTQKSLDAYRQALVIDPDFLPARFNLAMLHNSRHEPQEAESQLRRVTELAPDNGEGFYSLGLLLAEQKRLTEAETAIGKAASLMPGNARVLYNHGVLLLQLGKQDDGERQLIRAYQADQKSVDILSALVGVSLQKQEYEKALGRIQLLRKLEPTNPQWMNLFNQVQTQYQHEQKR
jgi:tetratricopeptide (TPR) repeat protein